MNEEQLEIQFLQIFRETRGINLVFVSGQNIDLLVTTFQACKRGSKTFVIDLYIAIILSELAKLGYKIPFPSPNFSEIKVFFPSLLTRRIKKLERNDLIDSFYEYRISLEEISEKATHIVMTVRTSMAYEIKNIKNLFGGTFIYSMCERYKINYMTEMFLPYIKRRGMLIRNLPWI